jgi:hypothetical protein
MLVKSRRLRSRIGGRPIDLKSVADCSGNVECKWNYKLSKRRKALVKKRIRDVYEAKFIEIENDKIINGVANGTMNMNLNYNDKKYLAQINTYKPSKKNGIHVGDILCIEGGELKYCCFIALPGKVQWLGDDGDTPDFILNLLKYKPILDKYYVRYNNLVKNQDYFILSDMTPEFGLQHILTKNRTVIEHLLGSVVEKSMPQEIIKQLVAANLFS